MNDLIKQIRAEVAERIAFRTRADEEYGRPPMTPQERRKYGQELITAALDAHVRKAIDTGRPPLDPTTEARIARAVDNALFGLGGFQPLLDDTRIENINANAFNDVHVTYADGTSEEVGPVADSDEDLAEMVRTAAALLGVGERRFDPGCPTLAMELPDGSRLVATMAVSRHPAVSIRRHRFPTATLPELRRTGTFSASMQDFLTALVRARKNIVVVGATGGGKTTLLRAMASVLPRHERIITAEEHFELGLDRDKDTHSNVLALQARKANIEGEGEITLADLVRVALGMSPSRVIVGEVKGDECIPMLNAMTQGNDGSLCTLHASSSQGAFSRLASFAAQAPERLSAEAAALLVSEAVHFVVYLAVTRDGTRVISSIREVVGCDGISVISNEIYSPGPDRRAARNHPLRTETLDDLEAAGLDVEGWLAS
ncbi:CpaF family protein [Microtetraspora malaysiensis]|uniref:CpaF family protein n=1 Tax=Microtetraspora malaysiensis TaxID=161358 RepID=UPI003D8D32EF